MPTPAFLCIGKSGSEGGCIPINPVNPTWKARDYGQPTRFIEPAGEINTAIPDQLVAKVEEALHSVGKPVQGSKFLCLGLAYNPDLNDDRKSPSYVLIEKLEALGAGVGF